MIVVYACRMNENFTKYWEDFSNVNYLLHVAIVLDSRYKMKYVEFCFEQVYEASEAVTKIALVESTFNRLYEWYYDFYSSELGNEMNTPTRLGGIDDNDSDDIDDAFEKKLEDEASLETKSEIGKYLLDNLEKLGSSDILDWWKLNASNYSISPRWQEIYWQFLFQPSLLNPLLVQVDVYLMHLGVHYLLKQ